MPLLLPYGEIAGNLYLCLQISQVACVPRLNKRKNKVCVCHVNLLCRLS